MAERTKRPVTNESDGPAVVRVKIHLDQVRSAVGGALSGPHYVEMTKAIDKGLRMVETDARLLERYAETGHDPLDAFRVQMNGVTAFVEQQLDQAGWIEFSEFGHKWYWSLMVGGPIKPLEEG